MPDDRNSNTVIHKAPANSPRVLWVIAFAFLFFMGLTFSGIALADKLPVLIVSSSLNEYTRTTIKLLADSLVEHNITHTVIQAVDKSDYQDIEFEKYSLVIALNSHSTELALQYSESTPLLGILISRHSHDVLRNKYASKNWSALLLNHPVKRQLLLVETILGKQVNTGTILGPYSESLENDLNHAAQITSTRLTIEKIDITDQLISTLKDITHKSEALLAIPDPVAFNKKTIRGILLLSYRKGVPVFGFSRSYVKAGSVAAIHSEPEQISSQSLKLIQNFFDSGRFSEKTYLPEDFSVAINEKVARTLGIKLKPEDVLKQMIKEKEDAR